jgi:hypothetical protein
MNQKEILERELLCAEIEFEASYNLKYYNRYGFPKTREEKLKYFERYEYAYQKNQNIKRLNKCLDSLINKNGNNNQNYSMANKEIDGMSNKDKR